MSSVLLSNSTIQGRVSPTSFLEKLRARLAGIGRAIWFRLVLAGEAFSDRKAWENEQRALPPVLPGGPCARVVGFLIPVESSRILPLFEGSFSPEADPSGEVRLVAAKGNQGDITVGNGYFQMPGLDPQGPKRRFYSNEPIQLGSRRFTLKLIEEDQQVSLRPSSENEVSRETQ